MHAILIALALLQPAVVPSEIEGVAGLGHAEIEEFLAKAKIVDRESIPIGVTRPIRLTLSDGTHKARAVWKVISEYKPVKHFYDGGPPEIGFRDSYESEIAAYELAKLLEFDFVPVTVVRRVRRQTGSVQLWIDDCITEGERRRKDRKPPDPEAFARQMYNARLFHQLIHDSDYQNLSNLLVDPDFRLWVVDQSRAFRTQERILDPDYLRRFSSRHLDRLRGLTPELLDARLGKWLTKKQLSSLLARRDLLIQLAERRVAEEGADAVLY